MVFVVVVQIVAILYIALVLVINISSIGISNNISKYSSSNNKMIYNH